MPSTILPFLLASFVIELTPGPNMGYLAVLTSTAGAWQGWPRSRALHLAC